MRILDTPLPGLKIFEIEPVADSRGFFARTFCTVEAAAAGLESAVTQCSVSFNLKARTLRGLHWQVPPHAESKLIRCTAGTIFDVVVDIRRGSFTFGRWFGIDLSAANRRSLFIPVGFAHGFLTLEDNTEVLYQISAPYVPGFGRGLVWNDRRVDISWPVEPAVMIDRDASLPTLNELSEGALFSLEAE